MKRLSTYFALLSTMLAALACVLFVALFNLFGGGVRGAVLSLLIVLAIVFVLSLVIAHFLTDPLRSLERKITAYRAGDTGVDFAPDGRLYEADVLVDDFRDLIDSCNSQSTGSQKPPFSFTFPPH